MAELDAGIDALLDAELGQVVAATTAIDIPAIEARPGAPASRSPGRVAASAPRPNGQASNGDDDAKPQPAPTAAEPLEETRDRFSRPQRAGR